MDQLLEAEAAQWARPSRTPRYRTIIRSVRDLCAETGRSSRRVTMRATMAAVTEGFFPQHGDLLSLR
jgi:hypothetical protein